MKTYENGLRAAFGALALSTAACAPSDQSSQQLETRYTELYEAEKSARGELDECRAFVQEYPQAAGCEREERDLETVGARRDELSLAMSILRAN